MQVNKTDNVIFLKDVESNLIQEAFVILKDNIKFEKSEKNECFFKKDIKQINILKEAEALINQEFDKNNLKFEKYKISKLQRKIRILRLFNIFLVIALISFIIIK